MCVNLIFLRSVTRGPFIYTLKCTSCYTYCIWIKHLLKEEARPVPLYLRSLSINLWSLESGLAQWHIKWSCQLQHWHLIWLWVRKPAASLLIQLPANGLQEAVEDGANVWAPVLLVGNVEGISALSLACRLPLWSFGEWIGRGRILPFLLEVWFSNK